jgi:hypothetical protein
MNVPFDRSALSRQAPVLRVPRNTIVGKAAPECDKNRAELFQVQDFFTRETQGTGHGNLVHAQVLATRNCFVAIRLI